MDHVNFLALVMTPYVLWVLSWIKKLHTSYESDPPQETVIWSNYRKSSLLDKNLFQSSGDLGFGFFPLREERTTTVSAVRDSALWICISSDPWYDKILFP